MVLEQPAVAQWPGFLSRLKATTPDLLLIDFPQFERLFLGAAQMLNALNSDERSGCPPLTSKLPDETSGMRGEAELIGILAWSNRPWLD